MVRVSLRVDAFWHCFSSLMEVVFAASMLVSLVHAAGPATTSATARNFKIINSSGARIELHWVNVSGVFCLKENGYEFGVPFRGMFFLTFGCHCSH